MAYTRPYIAVANTSTVLTNPDVHGILKDVQEAIDKKFYQSWLGVSTRLKFVEDPKELVKHKEVGWIVVADNSDVADALGYHDLTPENQPISKVFAKTDIDNGYNWTITFTHELWEMLIDPYIGLGAQTQDGKFYAYEIADPVEDDSCAFKVGETMISDFVTPVWFEDLVDESVHELDCDYNGKVTMPLQLAPGGYISVWDGKNWSQIFAQNDEKAKAKNAPIPHGSRRERRMRGRANWKRSKIEIVQK